jgi:hypothetical protein
VAAVARDCQPGRLPRSQTAASHLMMTRLTRCSCNTGGARSTQAVHVQHRRCTFSLSAMC